MAKISTVFKILRGLHLSRKTPRTVSINITNKCNQHCIYCEIGQGYVKDLKPLLAFTDIVWIVDEMKQSGIAELVIGGGEPFLFRDIFKVVEYAGIRGIRSHLLTNGMCGNRIAGDQAKLLERYNSKITFSIDSFKPSNEDYIRGVKNSLQTQLGGINFLKGIRIDLTVATVISVYNYNELYDIVRKSHNLGLSAVFFQPVIFESNFPEVDAIADKKQFNLKLEHINDVYYQFDKILDFEKHNDINTNVGSLKSWLGDYITSLSQPAEQTVFFEKLFEKFFCYPLHFDVAINYYGDLLPCNMLKPRLSIKNRNGRGLLELWNEACSPLRDLIKQGNYPSVCKSCVCNFYFNLYCSFLKYPFSNYRLIKKITAE